MSASPQEKPIPASRSAAKALNSPVYFTGKPCKNGHITTRITFCGNCHWCKKEYNQAYNHRPQRKAYLKAYNKTPARLEDARERGRKRLSTPEGRALNRLRTAKSMKRPEAKALQREAIKRYMQTPKGRLASKRGQANRRARKNNALPQWADIGKINEFINGCPPGFDIDHILPLAGRNVCGLHVLENLQFLPKIDNCSKHNRVDPLTLDYAICVLPGHRTYTHG